MKTAQILWMACMVAVATCAVLAWLVSDGVYGIPDDPLWSEGQSIILWSFSVIAAVVSLGLAWWTPTTKGKSLNGKPVNGVFVRFLFRSVFALVPVLMGLILSTINEDVRHALFLSALSMLCLLANRPS